MNGYKSVVMAIATNDVHRVHCLVRVALKQQHSPKEIVTRIKRAVEDVYHARGYTTLDVHLALLMYRLAGRKGLYICRKAIGLPSLTSLFRHHKTIQLLPSSSSVKAWEIAENIQSLPVLKSTVPRCGQASRLTASILTSVFGGFEVQTRRLAAAVSMQEPLIFQ